MNVIERNEWILNEGDKIQLNTIYKVSKLEYKTFYKDKSMTVFIINSNNFPLLEELIFGSFVQIGVHGQILEISKCPLLKTIQFGERSFNYYTQFVFRGNHIS